MAHFLQTDFALKVLHSSIARKQGEKRCPEIEYFLFLFLEGLKDDTQFSRAPASGVKQQSGRNAYTLVKEAAPLSYNNTKAKKITKRSFKKRGPAKWLSG